jgi:hypothetical protein
MKLNSGCTRRFIRKAPCLKNGNCQIAESYLLFKQLNESKARKLKWRPYRESNPGYLREREVS